MKQLVLVLFIFTTIVQSIASQNLWTPITVNDIKKTDAIRVIVPDVYKTFQLNSVLMDKALSGAKKEFDIPIHESQTIIELPLANGKMESFYFLEFSMMEPELQEKFPDFKTYLGHSINDPSFTLRVLWTKHGFHAIMKRTGETHLVDSYFSDSDGSYIAYRAKDDRKNVENFECYVEEDYVKENENKSNSIIGNCELVSYRLAMAATAEYSNGLGATSSADASDVLNAVTTTILNVNSIFEAEFGIRLVLIANTTDLFYYTPAADPYPYPEDTDSLLKYNDINVPATIGNPNFDIGHVLSMNANCCSGSGLAGLGVTCNDNRKAEGASTSWNPHGIAFDVELLGHEFGHMLGAPHSWNRCQGFAGGSTGMETASGSTIMGYPGICFADYNVQNTPDQYFAGISIDNIISRKIGSGASCATSVNTTNNQPTVNDQGTYTIPVNTPICLEAIGSDADASDILTYCWEQMDNETNSQQNPPLSTNPDGPIARSFPPTTNPNRYIPAIENIIANTYTADQWVVLPSVARNLNFRVTVRDNHAAYNCIAEDDLSITISEVSGPFLVTSPNTAVSYSEGSSQTFTWDVASTNLAPVNCSTVDIFVSLDGGFTYTENLGNFPNNGSATVIIPLTGADETECRAMVKGGNNIFFDISNVDFTITQGAPDFTLSNSDGTITKCNLVGQTAEYTIDITNEFGYSDNISFTASGNPSGTNVNFNPNPVSGGGTSTIMTVSALENAVKGSYSILVTGTGTSGARTTMVDLDIIAIPDPTTLNAPANGMINTSATPNLTWATSSGTDNYDVQLDDNMAFTSLEVDVSINATNYSLISSLSPDTEYFWRVRATNSCGESAWSTVFSFTTSDGPTCQTYIKTDLPVALVDGGTLNLPFELSAPGDIVSVTTYTKGTHTYIEDMTFSLISPEGTEVILIDGQCTSMDNFDIGFNDDSATGVTPCPYTDGNYYQPVGSLGNLVDETGDGTWILRAIDAADADDGNLEEWEIYICYEEYFDYLLTTTKAVDTICIPVENTLQFEINSSSLGGYTSDIQLSFTGIPSGATGNLSSTTISPGGTATLTVSGLDMSTTGLHTVTVTGDSPSGMKTLDLDILISGTPTIVNLLSPQNGATDLDVFPIMNWQDEGISILYDLEIDDNSDFSSPEVQETIMNSNFQNNPPLTGGVTYYWRVKGISACEDGGWSATRSFSIRSCITYTVFPNKLINQLIPPSPVTIMDTISFPNMGIVGDININVKGKHEWFSQLTFRLISPDMGVAPEDLFADLCSPGAYTVNYPFDVGVDEQAPGTTIECPAGTGEALKATGNLANFNGMEASGDWILSVVDGIPSAGEGILEEWSIEICLDPGVGCDLVVTSPLDSGAGTLRDVISCANPDDIITFDAALNNQNIVLTSGPLTIDKNLTFSSDLLNNLTINGTLVTKSIIVSTGNTLTIAGLKIIAGTEDPGGAITNNGDLILENVEILKNPN